MAQIAGFRGVVPQPSKVGEVMAAGPIGFIDRLANGTMSKDPGRALYRYHQIFPDPAGPRNLTRKLMIAAVRLSPWSDGLIRPHEASDATTREEALATIRSTGAYLAPVVAGYRDAAAEVDRQFRGAEAERPLIEHATADGTTHRVWRVQSAEVLGKLRTLFAPKKLHVLDGHDLYEAMLAYHAEVAARHDLLAYSSANYGLMCLANLDDPALIIGARHRVIRGANAKSSTALAAARKHFIVEILPDAAKDPAKLSAALRETVAHQPAFVAVFAGEPDAWKLTLSPDVTPTSEGIDVHRGLQKYDAIVTESLFIERTLPGATITTEADPQAALAAASGPGDVALIMRPLTLEQLTHVTELGQVLPAGSTAFYPCVAAGLVSMLIDPDEDLQ